MSSEELLRRIGRVRDRIALRTHAINPIQAAVVDGVGAEFHTPTIETLYRVRGLRDEEPVIRRTLDEINKGDIVWDVGANIGTHALLFVAAGAHVVAFEPHPPTTAALRKNIELNNANVEVVEAALSNETTTSTLLSTGDPAAGTHHVDSDGGGKQISLVRGVNVDKPTPDVLKIDVEGHELEVLEGMEDILKNIRYAIVEVHAGVNPDDVENYFSAHGLRTSIFDSSPRDEPYVEAHGTE